MRDAMPAASQPISLLLWAGLCKAEISVLCVKIRRKQNVPLHFALSSSNGVLMLWRTRVAVEPRNRSASKRWPWVLMATKSQPFLLNPFDDFARGLAIGKFGLSRNSGRLEFGANFFEVLGVFGNFGAHGVLAVGSGGPAIRDVQQNETAMREFGEVFDMLDDGAIGRRAVQSDENGVVHGDFAFIRRLSANNHLPRRFDGVGQAVNIHGGDQDSTGPSGNQ